MPLCVRCKSAALVQPPTPDGTPAENYVDGECDECGFGGEE